jgi:hypothetical protein
VFQDLMGLAAEQSGIGGGRGVSTVARLTEGWAARGAAAVGVIAEGMRPYVESLGVEPGLIRRVRNWTHTGEATVERQAMRAWLGLRPTRWSACTRATWGTSRGWRTSSSARTGHRVGAGPAVCSSATAARSLEALAARRQLAKRCDFCRNRSRCSQRAGGG